MDRNGRPGAHGRPLPPAPPRRPTAGVRLDKLTEPPSASATPGSSAAAAMMPRPPPPRPMAAPAATNPDAGVAGAVAELAEDVMTEALVVRRAPSGAGLPVFL